MKDHAKSRWRTLAALLPAISLFAAALLLGSAQDDARRLARLADHARLTAATVDLRLEKLLEVAEYCATSPDLVNRVDLTAVAENCGRYARLINAWIVIVELGETHRQILKTRPDAPPELQSYPRTAERATLLDVESRSRATGGPVLSDAFMGKVYPSGIITAGQFVRLADGREAMVYVSVSVRNLSAQLGALTRGTDLVLGLVDPSRRIVARSQGIDTVLFAGLPVWTQAVLEAGKAGASLRMPGPEQIGGTWDTGYHPLSIAPGWMAVAVQPVPVGFYAWRLVSLPSALILAGLVLSGALFWLIADRDRSALRLATAEAARAEAERNDTERSRLLASFAHDIRSPLISLIGSLELLDDTAPDRTASARASAEALLQLVDNILELAFLGSSEFSLNPTPVDVRGLVANLIDQTRPVAEGKGLALHVELDPALPRVVEVDRLRLQRVLSNLMTNAVKYTQDGSVTLRIRAGAAQADRASIAFAVEDTGIGIAAKDLPCVLQEFGRLDRNSAHGAPGTGLGLAIVQRILRRMGSALTIDSTPGKGSVFGFVLNVPVLQDTGVSGAEHPLAGISVLYVEDEPIICKVTSRRLAAAGAHVIEATDGADALAQLARITPDLLLLDLQMPVIDGLGVIRRVRADRPRIRYPVFVLTSHIAGAQAAAAKAAGADMIFTKPVQIEPLAAALRAWRKADAGTPPAVAATTAATAAGFVDADGLRSVLGMMDPATAATILDKFASGIRQDIGALTQALQDGDGDDVGRLAHRCLGLCQVLGAVKLAEVLAAVEAAARRNDLADAAGRLGAWNGSLEATLHKMRALLEDVHPGARGGPSA